jgi:hypothetical protein
MRILLGATLFLLYLSRQGVIGLFFTDQGILPSQLALEVIPEFYRPVFSWAFWPDSWNGAVHGVYLVGLLCFTLGLGVRATFLLTWVLHTSFIQRNYGVAFGADLIGGLFLLYLSFTHCAVRYSLNHLLGLKSLKEKSHDLLSNAFYRVIQIQLCIIYGYTGFEKLKGSTWWDGTALWSVFANPQMVIWDMTWMSHFPWVIVYLTFTTVLFEIYFPALVWFKPLKFPLLVFGVAFHFGIGLLMSLFSFAFVMLAPYFLFLESSQLDTFDRFLRRWKMTSPSRTP